MRIVMKTTQYWYLKNHDLFSQMQESEIQGLCMISGFKKALKNEVIYFAHEPVKRLYVLKKGILKIAMMNEQGDEITKEIIRQGDIFGEIALNKTAPQESEYAKVLSDEVVICSFTLDDFEHVLKQNPVISLKFTKQVGDKFKILETRYTNLIFKDVRTRVVDYIKKYTRDNGKLENTQWVVKNYLTHQDLASLTGASRQTVTSILNQLEKENQLIYSRSKIIIPDIHTLH